MAAVVSVEDARVRHHARRFQEKRAEVVLHRYELQSQQMDRAKVEKLPFTWLGWASKGGDMRRLHRITMGSQWPVCYTCAGVDSSGALPGQIDELVPPDLRSAQCRRKLS